MTTKDGYSSKTLAYGDLVVFESSVRKFVGVVTKVSRSDFSVLILDDIVPANIGKVNTFDCSQRWDVWWFHAPLSE